MTAITAERLAEIVAISQTMDGLLVTELRELVRGYAGDARLRDAAPALPHSIIANKDWVARHYIDALLAAHPAAAVPDSFDAFTASPFYKVVMESIAKDHAPRDPAAVQGEVQSASMFGFAHRKPEPAAVQGDEPEWLRSLRKEVSQSPMKTSFYLTRDEVIHLFGGVGAVMQQAHPARSTDAPVGGVPEDPAAIPFDFPRYAFTPNGNDPRLGESLRRVNGAGEWVNFHELMRSAWMAVVVKHAAAAPTKNAPVGGVPEGYALVPLVLTPEMEDAGWPADTAQEGWERACAAAPTPPTKDAQA